MGKVLLILTFQVRDTFNREVGWCVMESFDEETEKSPTPLEPSSESARLKMDRRRGLIIIAAGASALLLVAYTGGNTLNQNHPTEAIKTKESADTREALRDPETLHRAEQIISTFENSTTEIQYDFIKNLGDGRGITAGRAGFTSGTSDLLDVIKTYAALGNENTALAKLTPALEAVDGTNSVEGLDGFAKAWEEANQKDDTLKQAQDSVYKKLYLDPALKRADAVGIHTAIGQTIILDTIIQHGEGEDADGLPSIINETIKKAGAVEGQEEKWLQAFLDIRQHHLENAADPETRDGWKDSVDRVEALRSILISKNLSLAPPITWEVYGDPFSITE